MKTIEKVKDDSFTCFLFPKCSGCKFQENVRIPPVWNEIQVFFKNIFISFPLELISKEIVGWRSKAKLAVRGTKNHPQMGLFEEDSHKVVDLRECPLHYPVMDQALEKVRNSMIACGIEPYDEKSHTGLLRYIQMLVNRKTSALQLCLVLNASFLEEKERQFVKQLYKVGFFHSVWANFLPEKTNSILGKNWELLEGEEAFFQEIRGISFYFHPSCFSQAHLSLFEEMISYIDSLVPDGKSVVELYAGVGCIGLSLAQKSSKVLLVESSPYAKECFEKSIQNLSKEIQAKCSFFSGMVEDSSLSWKEAEVIVVDPPRKGLSKECKVKLFESDATQLIYVSCGYASFMRDCKEILEKGWVLDHARGFLLFPGTDHVELIANFKKKEDPM